MKIQNKLIVAGLALGTVGAAFAQSSVTIYGRINTTVEHRKAGDASVTGLYNNSSRFGSLGREDLGNGLHAGFQLESGFNSDDGKQTQPNFFGRQSEVNLGSTTYGTVRLGNFTDDAYYATADYVSMVNHDTGTSADALYAYVGHAEIGDTNKVGYKSPTFNVFGGSLQVLGAFKMREKAVPFDGQNRNGWDTGVYYDIGNLNLGAGAQKHGDRNQWAVRALYTLGDFKFGGYYQRDRNGFAAPGGTFDGGSRNNYRLVAAYFLGANEFHLNAGHADSYKKVHDSKATQWTVGYNYNLSKRTKVYSYFSRINNGDNAAYGWVNNPGENFRTIAAGIRHAF